MLQKTEQDGVTVVLVQENRLDGVNADLFKEQLVAFVDDGNDRFVLDLSNVEFIDSKGIGVLVAVHKKLMNVGTCCLASLRSNVQKIFSISRIDRLLAIYPTVEEAIKAVKA